MGQALILYKSVILQQAHGVSDLPAIHGMQILQVQCAGCWAGGSLTTSSVAFTQVHHKWYLEHPCWGWGSSCKLFAEQAGRLEFRFPSPHVKSQVQQHAPEVPNLEEQRQVDPGTPGQSELGSPRFHERTLSQKVLQEGE